jgi:peptide/nickel transport system substrate-binding protein
VSDRKPLDLGLNGEVSRRKLLKGAGAGMLVVGGGGLLAACGSSDSTTGGASTGTGTVAEGKPVPGGVLRVGAQGGSNTDSLDAHNVLSNTDFARTAQLYDPLVRLNTKGQPEKVLAESVESNKDATQWTIKLKPGVKFHDGSPCNAKAVLYTFNRIVTGEFPGSNVLGPLDLKKSKAVDDVTLQLEYKSPYAILYEALAGRYEYLYIVPPGYNPKKPIGTGPFKLKTFTPGRESTVVKFDEYWDSPKPYLDEVQTININEETAQVSALQSGQVDVIDYLTAASVSTLESGGFVVSIAETGGWAPITMMCSKPPFDDNRVREAMKLIPDRPTMLKSVFGEYGNVANDHFGRYTPAVESLQLPQHEQDLEKAASLLKSAGQDGAKFQLYTTEVAPGMTQTAQVFATQAQAGGIDVEAIKQPVTEYFARSYLKQPFAMDYWAYEPYLVTAGQATITDAVFSATLFSDPTYDKYYQEAIATQDENLRNEIIQKMVKIDWAEGGNLIPLNFPVIDSWAQNVHGITPSVLGQALSNFQFQNFWMT